MYQYVFRTLAVPSTLYSIRTHRRKSPQSSREIARSEEQALLLELYQPVGKTGCSIDPQSSSSRRRNDRLAEGAATILLPGCWLLTAGCAVCCLRGRVSLGEPPLSIFQFPIFSALSLQIFSCTPLSVRVSLYFHLKSSLRSSSVPSC